MSTKRKQIVTIIRRKESQKKSKTKSKSSTSKERNRPLCRLKYMYISLLNKKNQYLGTNFDAPMIVEKPQIWLVCRPHVGKDNVQFFYILDELGRPLTHRICGIAGKTIVENEINNDCDNQKWIIDNKNHRIIPYSNHLMTLEYKPGTSYTMKVNRWSETKQNQKWYFSERSKTDGITDRERVRKFSHVDIEDLFVSHQNSKLLRYIQTLPNVGKVKVIKKADNEAYDVFCYIDLKYWEKYDAKLRKRIIQHYDFADSASLYHFINKYYPIVVKHHKLTPDSKLFLATKIYKTGPHISLYKDSRVLEGKEVEFKSVALNHVVCREYEKKLSEDQFVLPNNKYYGLTWLFVEIGFQSPLTCFNSQMPIPHISVGLILYDPEV